MARPEEGRWGPNWGLQLRVFEFVRGAERNSGTERPRPRTVA